MCGRESIEYLQQLMANMMQDITKNTVEIAQALEKLLTQYMRHKHDMRDLLTLPVKQKVQTIIQNQLKQCKYADGAGFASHIEDKDYWILEWWFKQADADTHRYFEIDQSTQQRLDFRTFEWFQQTTLTHKTYIHGPYVDYVCSTNTAYTTTTAHPILYNGKFMGVAVLDVLISTLEHYLLPTLNKIKHAIVITNQDGRIVLSNVPKLRTGSIIKLPAKLVFASEIHPFKILVI
ncbi:PDC sensor domain-containing protein [Acinetobacter sp. HY1485]|uniref:PDC sensor domain-containing protein n=1 Tax=Acinetobacter sp. HY1485 TaxID=2970918 RepID=UPI0022B95E7C|nr:histidine kinase [Acinetobacter sp. HY1485]